MRIVMFGAGGVGAYFGGRLAHAGEDVTFIARGTHLEALRRSGLRVDSMLGDFVVHSVRATDDPRHIGAVDFVVVAVKGWQVSAAAEVMRPLVGRSTCVVPLQNGVEAPGQLTSVLGPQAVVGGLCWVVSLLAGPGHVRHVARVPTVTFGELAHGPSPRLERLQDAFARAGVAANIVPDITGKLWAKLLFIGPCSGMGALTRAPIGEWRIQPDTRRVAEQLMREVVAVASGRGITLPNGAFEEALALIDSMPAETTVSMQRDMLEGRPSELDAQVAAVIRFGREAGVSTPVHEIVYARLSPLEAQARSRAGLTA